MTEGNYRINALPEGESWRNAKAINVSFSLKIEGQVKLFKGTLEEIKK